MGSRHVVGGWVLLVVWLVAAGTAVAQEQTGSIQGVVRDSSGAVMPGVTVEARSPALVGVSSAVTDGHGGYRFPALPPGTYEITASLTGFTSAKVADAVLALGQLLRIDLALTVGPVTESVQVTGGAPLIDVKQNATFATIQQETIAKIPKGRDYTDLVKTAPGAQAESRNGGIQIDGSSGSENRFIIDGMDTTSLRNGTSGKTMLVDFLQEVQVKSSGYNAEFGGALGGVINAVTKSGSNRLRGSAGLYFQNTALGSAGTRRPSVRYYPYDQYKTETGMLSTETPWTYLSPIGDVGGPILKDRLWYYVGIGYTSNRYNRDAIFYTDPSKAVRHFEWGSWAVYPNYNVTAQLGSRMRLRFAGAQQYNRSRKTAPGLQPENSVMPDGRSSMGITTSTFDTDPQAFKERWDYSGSDSINHSWSGNFDWMVNSTFFVNATGGFFRTNSTTPEEFRGTELRHSFGSSNSDSAMIKAGFPTVPVAYQQASGYVDKKSTNGTVRNLFDRLFFNANTVWFKSLGGQHVFKAGLRFERFANDLFYGNTKPTITLNWGQTYNANDGRVLRGTYGYYTVNQTGTVGDVVSNNYAIWFQDSWSVNNRLTINAGIRSETEHIPSYKKTEDAIDVKFGFADKIAPRVGFAYDIRGDGRWKAYGSYGWFYDITKLELPIGQWGGDHWINYYWSLDTYDWASISCGEGPTGCPGTFYEQWDARRSTNQFDPDLSAYFGRPMTGVDPDMKPVRTGEFTLGVDRELNRVMSLGVRYVHKWLDRTIEDVGILFPGIGEIYIHGNPGFGLTEVMIPEFPQYVTPKATRKYDAVEVRFRRRMANNWQADLGYTWSRLWGNYSGLASSDEGGRTSPNVNRYFDALYMSYDKNQQPTYGPLHTDRPHVFKASGVYETPWGTSLGAFWIIESGLVETEEFTFQGYPVYPNGRGNLGRSPVFSQLDLQVSHDFNLGSSRRLTLLANIDNVFDQMTRIRYYSYRQWRTSVNLSDAVYFGAPWEPAALVAQRRAAGALVRDELLYMVPNSFQGQRSIRLQARFSF
ncbi:MAG: TonB-dependent receptor [Acidobacteriota bacterium]